VKIHWILKEAKHCDECIRYAAGSPYTKKTLPAVPRDGTSRCLSNCRCELRFEYAEEKPKPEIYVIKGPKPMIAPEGYRLPSDKERDELAQMSTEIDRLRELIRITSGPQKKEYIQMRRDLNATMIDFMEKHKIYYVPMGQVQKTKFVESIADEVKKELLLEGGPGSGHWGHRGRPGMRGGSLPGAGTAGHGVARSSQMAAWLKAEMVAEGRRISPDEATVLLKRMFPGQPEERYGRALVKAGLGVLTKVEAPPDRPVLPIENVRQILNSKKVPVSGSDADKEFAYKTLALVPESHLRASGIRAITFMTRKEVNELWELRSGGKRAKGFDIDGFYDFDFGDLVLASKHGRSGEIVLLHEFGHSVGGKLKGKYQGEVWRKNGSTGKITSYGKENPKEAWAEGYWMFVLDRGRLKRKAPSIAEVYEGAFAE